MICLRIGVVVSICSTLLLTGCDERAGGTNGVATSGVAVGPAPLLLSVTSDASVDPQAVDMAMKLAGFSLEGGRQVFMFFNVKGVLMPTGDFPEDYAFKDNQPLKKQLQKLIEDGVVVHVCPICMKGLGVEKEDLMVGASVTTRAELFARIQSDTAVFSY